MDTCEAQRLRELGLALLPAVDGSGSGLDSYRAGKATLAQLPQQLRARLVTATGHQVLVAPLAGTVPEVDVAQLRTHPFGDVERVGPRDRGV